MIEILEGNEKNDDETKKEKTEGQRYGIEISSRKIHKPKALAFWETQENNDRPPPQHPQVDFRRKTVHKMSTDSQRIPKNPPKDKIIETSEESHDSQHINQSRSQRLDSRTMDTSDEMARTEARSR